MVKRLLLGSLLVLTALIATGQQTWDEVPRRALRIDPFTFWIGTPNLYFEQGVSNHSAFEVSLAGSWQHENRSLHRMNVIGAGMGYRFYMCYWNRFMPWAQVGMEYAYAWGKLDLFAGNEGWEITTRPTKVGDGYFTPVLGLGFRVVASRRVFFDCGGMAMLRDWEESSVFEDYAHNFLAYSIGLRFSLGIFL